MELTIFLSNIQLPGSRKLWYAVMSCLRCRNGSHHHIMCSDTRKSLYSTASCCKHYQCISLYLEITYTGLRVPMTAALVSGIYSLLELKCLGKIYCIELYSIWRLLTNLNEKTSIRTNCVPRKLIIKCLLQNVDRFCWRFNVLPLLGVINHDGVDNNFNYNVFHINSVVIKNLDL